MEIIYIKLHIYYEELLYHIVIIIIHYNNHYYIFHSASSFLYNNANSNTLRVSKEQHLRLIVKLT